MECGEIASELIYKLLLLMMKNSRISGFCRAAERHFQSLAGPRNYVSVDLKYDVLCL